VADAPSRRLKSAPGAGRRQKAFAFGVVRRYLMPRMFEGIKAELVSLTEKLAMLRRFL
jgi:hypothetical protein